MNDDPDTYFLRVCYCKKPETKNNKKDIVFDLGSRSGSVSAMLS